MLITDRVQPLNYSAHAIDDLSAFAGTLRHMALQSAHVLDRLIDMLRQSAKFILPTASN